ncbi:SAM dependent carboxyl methyltransferase [Dillenia turbinata]|uniref:SAM dependent carboxyl methyltransferase n=1 Tax=Dillenia turbinata TaxID=194707 RepID=A0AAN8VDS9_9MAGN
MNVHCLLVKNHSAFDWSAVIMFATLHKSNVMQRYMQLGFEMGLESMPMLHLKQQLLQLAIMENLDTAHLPPTSDLFTIPDIGCSIGPNTFITSRHQMAGHDANIHDLIEFQCFFSDHVSNDFNAFFAGLPTDRKYFVAGVPGSFH